MSIKKVFEKNWLLLVLTGTMIGILIGAMVFSTNTIPSTPECNFCLDKNPIYYVGNSVTYWPGDGLFTSETCESVNPGKDCFISSVCKTCVTNKVSCACKEI